MYKFSPPAAFGKPVHPAAKLTRKSQQFILTLNFKANFKNSRQIIFFALYTNYILL